MTPAVIRPLVLLFSKRVSVRDFMSRGRGLLFMRLIAGDFYFRGVYVSSSRYHAIIFRVVCNMLQRRRRGRQSTVPSITKLRYTTAKTWDDAAWRQRSGSSGHIDDEVIETSCDAVWQSQQRDRRHRDCNCARCRCRPTAAAAAVNDSSIASVLVTDLTR